MIKVLIAEDDRSTLDALAACVEAEGFEALCVENGQQALALWRSDKPDLICLDIMMPVMNGYAACKRIRESDPKTPILFLSAKNEERDIVIGLDFGADDFIRKPFTRDEVMARIRAALRRAGALNQDESFDFGDWTVMPGCLEAIHGDQRLDLTPREISMLKLLHDRKGQPVSRDAFLDACWGLDYFPNSRTLDQHISMLRKKVEADASSPIWIRTVHGIGYSYRGG